MSDATASTANQAKIKLRPVDLWQMWISVGFGIVLVALVIAGVLLNRSATEIATLLTMMSIGPGFSLYFSCHMGMVVRIARLEQRLAELEASRRS